MTTRQQIAVWLRWFLLGVAAAMGFSLLLEVYRWPTWPGFAAGLILGGGFSYYGLRRALQRSQR